MNKIQIFGIILGIISIGVLFSPIDSIALSNDTVLLTVSLVQVAEAKIYNEFYGLDSLFKDPYSVVKLYKSGGFSLKNYDLGMAIYAHPVSKTDMFKFIVFDWGDQRNNGTKISRFIAIVESEPWTEEDISIQPPSAPPTRIEPKSSIGADITKWNIPTINPKELEREPRIIAYLSSIDSIQINDEYIPNIKVENQDFKKITADVNLEISLDGHIIKSISDSIKNGKWSPLINIRDDLYPPGCYTVTLTATSGNYTDTVQDDFTVYSTDKYWRCN